MTPEATRAYARAYAARRAAGLGPWMTVRLDAPPGRFLLRQETQHSVAVFAVDAAARGAECVVRYHVGHKKVAHGPDAVELFESVFYAAHGLYDELDLELLL